MKKADCDHLFTTDGKGNIKCLYCKEIRKLGKMLSSERERKRPLKEKDD